ncbi:MAG: hypothetical protein BroJett030_24430 [Alphaproteobacteria bacterium]|nr:MAG: hypothetical protein BroJett030_24430 [Alphaproteobacteria bacterium]
MIETHRSIVAPSECDGNRHMNVSHYVRRFSEAGQNFLAIHGAGAAAYRPANRHFRFHRELEENSRVLVVSIAVGGGAHRGEIVHVMEDADRGFVSATCIDSDFPELPTGLPATLGGPPAKARPRSIERGRYRPVDVDTLVARRLAMVAHRNRVAASECDGDGRMSDGDLVGRFFASASHLWSYAGFDMSWFRENGHGGAAVEMKLTRHADIAAGQDYAIVSWVPRMAGKMLALSNQMVAVPDNRPLASISAVSIVLDHDTRTAVEIPEAFRRKHAARFGELAAMGVY